MDHKGKQPHNLYCDAQKGTNPAYREGYDRIFGKKPRPHGKKGGPAHERRDRQEVA